MYEILRYQRTNIEGTCALADIVVNDGLKNIRKIVVASSRAVYGEGSYRCREHGIVHPRGRSMGQMSSGHFEPVCPICGLEVVPVPTREDAPFAPLSFYGLTKQVQEQTVLMFGQALGIDAIALRYQNVYGPGQSLTNPYTGLLAVFACGAFAGTPLNVFEDGLESRDFVYIDDVVEVTAACLSPAVRGLHAMNVGSGVSTSVLEVAQLTKKLADSTAPIHITGNFRLGDIRHNLADTGRMKELTGIVPRWEFSAGLSRFVTWARDMPGARSDLEGALEELRRRGMLGGPRPC
jgi:dTDP-L-rhamnose 4-epimerase